MKRAKCTFYEHWVKIMIRLHKKEQYITITIKMNLATFIYKENPVLALRSTSGFCGLASKEIYFALH